MKSGTKSMIPAGTFVYLMRKRVPAFSITPPRGWKADAKPSVSRVDSKCVPEAKRFVMLMVLGTGEPKQRMVVLEPLVSNPRRVKATVTELLDSTMVLRLVSA